MKILMLGRPGGNLTRTYQWHIEALNSDPQERFIVDDIHEHKGSSLNISSYDFFWFYAKAFDPNFYYEIKKIRPNGKFIFGPNILLDKPDIGISDEWDKWYIEQCSPDLHLDQVDFYSNHVKKYLREDVKKVAKVLNKCIKIEDRFYQPSTEKKYDCLIYSKKRRYDKNFEIFRNQLLNMLIENDINYIEFKAGKFGNYEREDYFKALNNSKVMVNLSLDECPGILNYESMMMNVPVIGSPHNVPITSDISLYVKDTDEMTQNYLVRKEDAAEKYLKVIKSYLENYDTSNVSHRDFIKEKTSYEKYANEVFKILKEVI